ncbi:MAG TPA: hypothetical protein VEJ87_04480 [Acidimicrobiales bacterium]|nr:hypothetical protein [Acidimicrobiales bacterium]
MTRFGLILIAGLALLSLPVATGSAAAVSPASSYTCSGGNIPPGTYASVNVTGVCFFPSGSLVVEGDVTVEANSLLDAASPAPSQPLPGIVTVDGNTVVEQGGVLLLGCNAAFVCPSATTAGLDLVKGSVRANGALGVIVHAITVEGSVSLVGGGGGTQGPPSSGICDSTPIPSLWAADPTLDSLFGLGQPTPVYSDFEDNTIDHSLYIDKLHTCWFGALRNKVAGNMTNVNGRFGDPDADEVDANVVSGNFACSGNKPAVQFGDSGAAPNSVAGHASGQCGFKVVLYDESYEGGTYQHISVKS